MTAIHLFVGALFVFLGSMMVVVGAIGIAKGHADVLAPYLEKYPWIRR